MNKRQSGASSPCKNGACRFSPFPNPLPPCPLPVENPTTHGHRVARVGVHKLQSSVQIYRHPLLLGCQSNSNISSIWSSLANRDIPDAPTSKTCAPTSKTSTHLHQPLFPSTIGTQPHHITFLTTKSMVGKNYKIDDHMGSLCLAIKQRWSSSSRFFFFVQAQQVR